MGALTIAFDTVIVGALALPWVLLLLHLFFSKDEEGLVAHLKKQPWINNQGLTAVAGVLLFAMAYTLGSAVSRIAQDFFNDDDLHVPNLLRMAMTEDRIIASVYCDTDRSHLVRAANGDDVLADRISAFQCLKSNNCKSPATASAPGGTLGGAADNTSNSATVSAATASPQESLCRRILSAKGSYMDDERHGDEMRLIQTARDIFSLQENGLLLKGEDPTLRLRQLHDQIMVLRGATFNGLLACSLCLFAWGMRVRHEKPRSVCRWVLALLPAVYLFLAANALFHHYQERAVGEPPYMEFSLFLLGAVGALLLWWPRSFLSDGGNKSPLLNWKWGALSLVFGVLVMAGVLGWWSTEVLYGEQVIYSYDSQVSDTQGATAPKR